MMRYLVIIFGFLVLVGCSEMSGDNSDPNTESTPVEKEIIVSSELKNELSEMQSDISSLYKDSILIDLIFNEDTTLTIISDMAIQEKNYLGYFIYEEDYPVLLYSSKKLDFIDSFVDLSNITQGYPTGYVKYNSEALLPPFEPFSRKYKISNSFKLELIHKGFI